MRPSSLMTLGALCVALCACPGNKAGDDAGLADAGARDGGSKDAGHTPGVVTLTVTGGYGSVRADVTPQWVAAHEGDGGWIPLSASDGGFRFPVRDPSGRYGLALVCPEVDGNQRVSVYEATVQELTDIQDHGCTLPAPTAGASTAMLTASGWFSGDTYAEMYLGNGHNSWTTPGTEFFIPFYPGTFDLVGLVGSVKTVREPDHFVLLHDLALTSTFARDINFSTGAPVQTFTLALGNPGPGDLNTSGTSTFCSKNRTCVDFPSIGPLPVTMFGLPLFALVPGDHQILQVATGSTDKRVRRAYKVVDDPLSATLSPPAFFTEASAHSAGIVPYPRATFDWSGAPTGAVMLLRVAQTKVRWDLVVTPGAGGAVNGNATHPDLSALTGWNNLWTLKQGEPGLYSVSALLGNRGVGVVLGANGSPSDAPVGLEYGETERDETITF